MWARSLNLNRASFVTIFDLPPLKYCPSLILTMIIFDIATLLPASVGFKTDSCPNSFSFEAVWGRGKTRERTNLPTARCNLTSTVEDGNAGYYVAISQISNLPPATFAGCSVLGIGEDCKWVAASCNKKSAKYDSSGKYLTVKNPRIFLGNGSQFWGLVAQSTTRDKLGWQIEVATALYSWWN